MKTFFTKFLLVVIGMIMASSVSFAQNVDTSFIINVENPIVHYENGYYTASEQTTTSENDKFCRFDVSGTISNAEATLLPGSIQTGTRNKSGAGNFFFAHDYFEISGGSGAYYYVDPTNQVSSRIRSIKDATAYSMSVTSSGNILSLTDCLPTSVFGNAVVGGTYGGTYGNSGVDLIPGSGGHVLWLMGPNGQMNDFLHFQNPSVEPVSVREINAGFLVEMLFSDGNVDSSYFLILDKNELETVVWETPHYPNAKLTLGESPTGDFILGINSLMGTNSYVEIFNSSFILIEDEKEYTWIGFGNEKIFATNDLIFLDQGVLGIGNGDIDYRYQKYLSISSSYNTHVVSVDTVAMTMLMYGSYTGSGYVLNGTPLVDVPLGQTGIVFFTVSLEDSGNKFTLDTSYPSVTQSFAYVEKTATLNEVIASEKHVGYMICDTAVLSSTIGVGNPMPSGGVYAPAGATLYSSILEYDTHSQEYYAVYGANLPGSEFQIFKVIFTEDPLYVPNNAPTYNNTTIVFSGTEDESFNADCSATDADSDILSYSIVSGVFPGGISLNAGTGMLSGVPVEYGIFDVELMVTDGVDSLVRGIQITIEQSFVSVDEHSIDEIILYPNPAIDVIHISYNGHLPLSAIIMSLSGQIVFSGSLFENQLSIYELNSGVYVITLSNESGNSKQIKFIKR